MKFASTTAGNVVGAVDVGTPCAWQSLRIGTRGVHRRLPSRLIAFLRFSFARRYPLRRPPFHIPSLYIFASPWLHEVHMEYMYTYAVYFVFLSLSLYSFPSVLSLFLLCSHRDGSITLRHGATHDSRNWTAGQFRRRRRSSRDDTELIAIPNGRVRGSSANLVTKPPISPDGKPPRK